MNTFRLIGDLAHLASTLILLAKILSTRSCRGLSFKTQALYALVFLCRYLDLFWQFISLYNMLMKIFFIASSGCILYLMRFRYRGTYEPQTDTFNTAFLLVPCFLLGLVFNYRLSISEVLWAFSIFLEAVAIIPQLAMLMKTREAELLTLHYVIALGLYRGMYIPNWYFRYHAEGVFDPIAVYAGVVQSSIYIVFFCVYFNSCCGPKLELPTVAVVTTSYTPDESLPTYAAVAPMSSTAGNTLTISRADLRDGQVVGIDGLDEKEMFGEDEEEDPLTAWDVAMAGARQTLQDARNAFEGWHRGVLRLSSSEERESLVAGAETVEKAQTQEKMPAGDLEKALGPALDSEK